jgi:hypothetical protein
MQGHRADHRRKKSGKIFAGSAKILINHRTATSCGGGIFWPVTEKTKSTGVLQNIA